MRDELPFSCHFVKLAPAACHVKVFLKEAGHSGAKSILNCKILFTMRVCLIWDSARMRDVLPFLVNLSNCLLPSVMSKSSWRRLNTLGPNPFWSKVLIRLVIYSPSFIYSWLIVLLFLLHSRPKLEFNLFWTKNKYTFKTKLIFSLLFR